MRSIGTFGAHLQDTFAVSKNLTITGGIRWEFPESFTEKSNRLTVLQPNAVDPLGTQVGLPTQGTDRFG